MKMTTKFMQIVGSALILLPSVSGCNTQQTETKENPSSIAAAEHHYFHKSEEKHAAHWGYGGEIGPAHWADLSPEYTLAKDGKQQSPINIADATIVDLSPIQFDYNPAKIDLVYNGHTIQETEEEGSSITAQGKTFALKQFHFHSPSEHTINGKHTDMELHLVHKDEAGHVAVVGVLINEGKHNPAFDPIWNHLPTEENRKQTFDEKVDAMKLLPESRGYFHYMGSFTTPPCTESVYWYVMTEPVELSAEQIGQFRVIISGNNRPVQPLNGREVVRTSR